MYEHKRMLRTWLSLVILSMSFLKLAVITTAIPCTDFSSVSINSPRSDAANFMVYQSFNSLILLYPIRDVFIYWRDFDKKNICGESFEYQVYCTPITEDENYNAPILKQTSKTYVKFEQLNTTFEYKCKIYSIIDHGLGSEYSYVDIPKEWDRNPKALSLTRIEFEEEGIFQLSWNPQELYNYQNSYYYTLFWCDMEQDRPYECINDLNWLNIASSETSYNITANTINQNYRFAISVNSENTSKDEFDGYNKVVQKTSGMILESCTVQSKNWIPGKMFNIEINVIASRYVQMFWTLDCSERLDNIQGYLVSYCPIASKQDSQCIEPITENRIYADNLPYAKIFNYGRVTVLSLAKLQPLTTYKFTISVLAENGEGLPSVPLFVTTVKEGDIKSTGLSIINWPNPTTKKPSHI